MICAYVFLFVQAAEESELPVMAETGVEGAERGIVANDNVSPSPNTQIPSASVAPPVSEIASTLASLRMVWFDYLCVHLYHFLG